MRGFGIARLWPWRQRAGLDVRKALRQKHVDDFGILVEAGGQPDRMVEAHVEETDRQTIVHHLRQAWRTRLKTHGGDRQRVRHLPDRSAEARRR